MLLTRLMMVLGQFCYGHVDILAQSYMRAERFQTFLFLLLHHHVSSIISLTPVQSSNLAIDLPRIYHCIESRDIRW